MKTIRKLNIFLLIVAIICAITFVITSSNEEKYGKYEDKITIAFNDIESNSYGRTDVSFTVTNNGKAEISRLTFEMQISSSKNSYNIYTTEVSCMFNYLTSGSSENLKCSLSLNYTDKWLVGMSKSELEFSYRITSVTFRNNKTYESKNPQFVGGSQNGGSQNGGSQNQHTHDYTTLKYDAEYHWQECSCGKSIGKSSHSYTVKSNENYHWQECSCGKSIGKSSHSYTVKSNENYHWQECSCGKQLTKELHNGNGNACLTCNYNYVFTEGVAYDVSSDGTYYEVVGYDGTDTFVRIKGEYNGLPVKTIYDEAFFNKNITNVVIPDSVTSIGSSAFQYCSKLTSVTIGNSVTSIGSSAFTYCYKLTSVTIGNSVTSIGSSAFYGCTSLTSIMVDKNNKNYKSIDGNLYSKSGKTLIQYAIGKTDTAFTIPNSVTSIGSSAFYNCDSLTSIIIPDSVTSIGYYAFDDCDSLTSVTIGNGVTSIGSSAFACCSKLTSVTIGNGVTSIDDFAFDSCDSLTSIVIPDSVTSIGFFAFRYCTSLTSIKYRGTSSQWSAISKGSYWNYDTGNYTITYNYTGD